MGKTLRVLNVEDSVRDAALLARHLSAGNYDLVTERVETADGMKDALRDRKWDVILCDYSMPQFNALAALTVLNEAGLDIPFLIISATVGEEVAVEAMLTGANDYLSKNNLNRLIPAIERELQEAKNRRAQRRAEKEQGRLNTEILVQRERVNNIIASVPGVVWEASCEPNAGAQRIEFISDHVETMLGYSVDEWLSTPDFWLKIVHADDRKQAERISRNDLERGKSNGPVEFRWITKNGDSVWVESNYVVIKNEKGDSVGLRGVTTDISERKGSEQALGESEERYRDLVENAHDIIYTHDLEGNYSSVNAAGERITGYTRAEFLRINVLDMVAPEFVEMVTEMMAGRVTCDDLTAYELEIIAKDGSRLTVEAKIRTIDKGGVPVLVQGIARNITNRKQLEEQLLQARKLESIGRLAGGIAHDFNNMLTAITGYSDLALRKLAKDSPACRDIEEVKKAGERSAMLTSQLLAFSRRQMLHPEVLKVNDVISETSSMLKRLIGEDVELQTTLEPSVGCIKVDPGQLSQILMNLSINARDAMANGGKLTVETGNVFVESYYADNVAGLLPGAYVTLSVADTGVGMAPEILKQIYDPFFTTKSIGEGTGLGLATVYGIVKQSGGHIFVYSEVGHGTTFKIYLPRVAEETEIPKTHDAEVTFALGTETILLVEDEELVRSLTREVLEACGYKVIEAADGVEALEIIEISQSEIDLLLTDVVMPRMGGRELAEILKKNDPRLPILFSSGYTDDAILANGAHPINVNFIQKPYSLDEVGRKVRELLDARASKGK